jgi:hypothetical protein
MIGQFSRQRIGRGGSVSLLSSNICGSIGGVGEGAHMRESEMPMGMWLEALRCKTMRGVEEPGWCEWPRCI